jgi:hypothetical protein
MFACLPALAKACLDDLPRCYRTGEGLPYDAYHTDITCGTCRELGVWVRHHLVGKVSGLPGLKEQLVQVRVWRAGAWGGLLRGGGVLRG